MFHEIPWKTYKDFVLKIERAGEDNYRAEGRGPTGEAENQFKLPFSPLELENFLLRVGQARKKGVRGRVPEPMKHTVEFGERLFNAVFSGGVRDIYISARHDAEQEGFGLRIQLRLIGAPELADIPWEYFYDGREFLALSDVTPVVRYLDIPNQPRPMTVELPLRILVTISSPHNLEPLNVDAERAKVEKALEKLKARQVVEIDFTSKATISTLQRALRHAKSTQRPYHIWHYIGHGTFDPATQNSMLAFCDDSNMSYAVGGFQLGTLFSSYPDIRLVLLNACEGARTSREDPFAGVAAALVERGIPAVIGMQCEISDEAAITCAEEFYAALVDGLPVDASLTEARRAVFFMPNWVEWATPVLFMRVRDGQLFTIRPPTHIPEISEKVKVESIPTLVTVEGPLAGWQFDLTEPAVSIGRTPDNLLSVADQRVSRHHARIEQRTDGLWIVDLDSTNGTFVNGQRLTEPHKLAEGDEITIGDSLFNFSFLRPSTRVAEEYGEIVETKAYIPDKPAEDTTLSQPPVEEVHYCPNRWGLLLLQAAKELMTEEGLQGLLSVAELPQLGRSFPPDNMQKDISFEVFGRLCHFLYILYGREGTQTVAHALGKGLFQDGLEELSDDAAAAEIKRRVGSLPLRVKAGLGFFTQYVNTVSDQQAELGEDDDHWILTVSQCPVCWGYDADDPVCHLTIGILESVLDWVSKGGKFQVAETDCKAKGDEACVFLIDKKPTS